MLYATMWFSDRLTIIKSDQVHNQTSNSWLRLHSQSRQARAAQQLQTKRGPVQHLRLPGTLGCNLAGTVGLTPQAN